MNETHKNNKKINLIPADLVVSGGIKTFKSLLQKANVILSIILVFSLLITVGTYFYFSIDLKNVTTSVEALKESITRLETSEQKLILAKDKLAKIKKITTGKSINSNLLQVKDLTNAFLAISDTGLNEINIDVNKMEISSYSKTSAGLTTIFNEFSKMTGFTKVVLSSLGYNPSFGYTTEISLSK